MKIEITEKGVYDAKGQPVPVGTTLNVEGDKVPNWLANKGKVVGKASKGATAVTNKAPKAGDQPSGAERQQVMRDAIGGLEEGDFTADGAPDVNALNKALPAGVVPFTADERDQLWPGVKA